MFCGVQVFNTDIHASVVHILFCAKFQAVCPGESISDGIAYETFLLDQGITGIFFPVISDNQIFTRRVCLEAEAIQPVKFFVCQVNFRGIQVF